MAAQTLTKADRKDDAGKMLTEGIASACAPAIGTRKVEMEVNARSANWSTGILDAPCLNVKGLMI